MDSTRLAVVLANANFGAFEHVVLEGEVGRHDEGAFRIVNGGGTFDSFDAHPYGELPTTKGGKAAGAHQWLPTTWAGLRKRWPKYLKGFTPREQTTGFALYLYELGALDDVLAGRIPQAIARLGRIWTSLPNGTENSGRYTLARALAVFKQYGGRLSQQPPQPYVPEARDDGTQPPAPIEYRDTPARPQDGGRIFNPEQDNAMPFPIIAAASLALPLVQSLIEAFSPLAKQKVAAELNRHTDDPAIGQQVADNVIAAIMKLTGKTDPVEAVVAVKTDPEVAKQAEALTLEELDKLAPLLEKIAAHDVKVWEAEDRGRDAAGARGRADGEKDIAITLIRMIGGVMIGILVVLGVIMIFQTVMRKDAMEPTTSILTLVGPLFGAVFGWVGAMVAYRYGTTRNNSLKDITVEQLSRRK